ncbi:cysteine hydrolase family protein [Yonghaparkia sp. Root332]|uniref:cysteine hydrolase family protein n=1 Tax=Yonghaparkia sp. Root332 TaxID=1736516 RepID=UPI0009EA72CE|nr:isochorismatase family cysteine hydrolase [Yonghaparkia sp. Root332]
MSGAGDGRPWLVVIDMQRVFGEEGSPWFAPGTPAIEPVVASLVEAFDDRVALTRFVAPAEPVGAWVPYYAQWPFALVPPTEGIWDLLPSIPARDHRVVTRTTFSKWDAELASIVGHDMVLAGVSTDCCVLSTALAAADAGVRVRVLADACAGVTEADHERALAAMALYAPLIEITTSAGILAEVAGA